MDSLDKKIEQCNAEVLPPPIPQEVGNIQAAQGTSEIESVAAQKIEQGTPSSGAAQAQPPIMQQNNTFATADPHASVPQSKPHSATLLPQIAEDSDLIEKEWVQKAKVIIETTKDNPHEQTKEVNRVKSAYLKTRYNKDIRSGE